MPRGFERYMPKQELFNQQQHPEIQEGEAWVGNYPRSQVGFHVQDKTRRLGETAYDEEGNIISGAVPVFVQRPEAKKES